MDLREMELRDTVEMMNSADYKERFKAEYYQTAIRYGKLKAMVDKYNNGTLEFKPTCPMSIYDIQLRAICDKCRNHYLLDGDESRCRSISLGMSSAMCCQISRCSKYEEKK